MGSIFLSHNSADKPFVNKLASDIQKHGHYAWVDRAEIKLGESLIGKIEEGIEKTDFLGVVLSSNSIKSEWVMREVRTALSQEINGRKVKVLPILLEKVAIPAFLLDKMYADFTEEANYNNALDLVLERLSNPESSIGMNVNGKDGSDSDTSNNKNAGPGQKTQINVIGINAGIVAGDGLNLHLR